MTYTQYTTEQLDTIIEILTEINTLLEQWKKEDKEI